MHKIATFHTTLMLSMVAQLFGSATAMGTPLPAFQITAALSATTIHPGEPLYISMTLSRWADTEATVANVLYSSHYGGIDAQILDHSGKQLEAGAVEAWYPSRVEVTGRCALKSGQSHTRTLIAHRWFSTDLAPGDYTVRLKVGSMTYRMGDDTTTWHKMFADPVTLDLSLKVLEADDAKVAEVYRKLVEMVIDQSVEPDTRMRAFDTLIFARSPKAIQAQLELVRQIQAGNVRETSATPFLWTMFRAIAHAGNGETARALVEFTKEPATSSLLRGGEEERWGVWRMLSWAIHELHRIGPDEVRSRTQDFVAKNEEPAPYTEVDFMDGNLGASRSY